MRRCMGGYIVHRNSGLRWGREAYGASFVQETPKKIQVLKLNIKKVQDQQRSNADKRRRDLAFQVVDRVYLKMAMLRGSNSSFTETKLRPRYMGQFRVIEGVEPVAYRLELSDVMRAFHKVFHVSMLRKCLCEDDQLLDKILKNLQLEARPVRVLERRVKEL
ncbi:PREDICTED: uncharacterized protein LOC104728303 [Camelina sativa]|uniref:Uncharacterized protein LOC104728303 n=1 Tax=Camelina sativa TaxID=90675 RepID=A0ABM0USL3_CAMSA|nr:PREDICTED: uncharacterized protein LOC104728303 [Camelina sativa]